MKKIFSVLLVMCLVISSFSFVFADSGQSVKVTQSEYDGIVKILGKSDSDFIEMGLSEEEIKKVKEYKIKLANNIRMYSQYPEKELKRIGFSDTQIKAFKQIKVETPIKIQIESLKIDSLTNTQFESLAEEADTFIADNLSRGLTGSVDMDVEVDEVDGDEVTFYVSWEWTGGPLVQGFKDTVGFAW